MQINTMKYFSTVAFCFIMAFAFPQTKIALIGCHVQDRESPSLDFFADSIKPDYAVWLGDNVYADTDTDPQHIQNQLDKLAAKTAFQKLKATTPFFVTWDDHDFGLNGSNKYYVFKEESKRIHRKFWDLEDKVPADRDGIYNASIVTLENGRTVQFIMLDCRYNKDKTHTKNGDVLGENQWLWLEEQLKQKADIRFIVSGIQILLPKPTKWEAWSKIGKSRKRLMDLLVTKQINNALFLTGDQHTTEILETPKHWEYYTYEIMACGINQTEKPGKTPNRVLGPDVTFHSSPVIELDWLPNNVEIHFTNYNAETKQISSSFSFSLGDVGKF